MHPRTIDVYVWRCWLDKHSQHSLKHTGCCSRPLSLKGSVLPLSEWTDTRCLLERSREDLGNGVVSSPTLYADAPVDLLQGRVVCSSTVKYAADTCGVFSSLLSVQHQKLFVLNAKGRHNANLFAVFVSSLHSRSRPKAAMWPRIVCVFGRHTQINTHLECKRALLSATPLDPGPSDTNTRHVLRNWWTHPTDTSFVEADQCTENVFQNLKIPRDACPPSDTRAAALSTVKDRSLSAMRQKKPHAGPSLLLPFLFRRSVSVSPCAVSVLRTPYQNTRTYIRLCVCIRPHQLSVWCRL